MIPLYPIAHARRQRRYNPERRRMVVRPWEMVYSMIDLRIWVTGAFGAELEYGPVGSVLVIQELDQLICRISVRLLGPY